MSRLRLGRLAWLPIPVFLVAMLVLRAMDLRNSYESLFLVIALNLVFSTLASLLVAYLIARSFLVGGTPGLLLLGCGVVLWGPAAVGAFVAGNDPNTMVTIHNSCVWLSALCHLGGVALSLRSRWNLSPTALWLPVAYVLAVGAVVMVVLSALAGWLPVFFVQGQGGTPVRQFVLISAIAMFALTALLLGTTGRRPVSAFTYWYALALGLIAVGLLGVLPQSSAGGVLGWVGRSAQFLGGVYMLIAAVASVRETHAWEISLDSMLRGTERRLQLALDAARMGTWDWDITSDNVTWNDEHYRILGHEPGRIQPSYQAWADRVHPEDLAATQAVLRRSMEQCTDYIAEYRTCWPDGTVHWAEARGRFEADSDGKTVRSYGVLIDITERKQVEQALRAAKLQAETEKRHLEAVLQSLPVGVIITDAQGGVLLTNGRDNQIWGSRPSTRGVEDYGQYRAWWADSGKPVEPHEWASAQAVLQGKPVIGQVLEIQRFDGGRRYVHNSAVPIRDGEGRVMGSAIAIQDITELRRAEQTLRESEEKHRSSFAHAAIGFAMTTPNGRLLDANPAYCKLTGYSLDELRTMGFPQLVHPDDLTANMKLIDDMLAGRIPDFVVENRCVCKNGNIVWVRESVSLVHGRDGMPRWIIILVEDVTERRCAEQALRELNATLESKVAQRTEELEHRARQLQKLALELSQTEDRERKRMADILHDDLQQQLAAAKFQVGLLTSRLQYDPQQQALAARLDEMLREAVEKSRSLSHDLSPAVLYQNNLRLTFEWLARHIRTRHGLVVRVDARHEVNLPSDAMKAFLYKAGQELLFNVVKHARVNEAAIRLRRWGRYVALAVVDHGRGFDPQGLRETTGFGLFSIRERVELLGGRMTIRSVEGKGSELRVIVPDETWLDGTVRAQRRTVRTSPEAPGRGRSSPTAKEHPVRVLLADDHEVVRQGLKAILGEEADIEVVGEAANGREAVDLAARLEPDVVIMDVSMPLISGDQAACQIKGHLPGTRVIALSMHNEPETAERMRQAGVDSYVLKTAPAEELLAAVRGK